MSRQRAPVLSLALSANICAVHYARDEAEYVTAQRWPRQDHGWASWSQAEGHHGEASRHFSICPDCWNAESYEALVSILGEPSQVGAMHPGPLPPELQHHCFPYAMEWMRQYDTSEDWIESRPSADPTRATRNLWLEPPLSLIRVASLKQYADSVSSRLAEANRRVTAAELAAVSPAPTQADAVQAQSGSQRSTAPMATTSDEVAGGYPGVELVRELGRGAFSTVYEVRRSSDGTRFALKVLSRKAFANTVARERFQREGEILARLQHPNIVRLYESQNLTGMLALLIELVSGGAPLREVIRRGKVAPARALGICEGVCAGLEHAHRAGIVHRDIKPDNILLDRQGTPKIADFGIAKILRETMQGDPLTGSDDLLGTPLYMAPEQLATPLDVDGRVDLYALGITLYEMLTGNRPTREYGEPLQKVDDRVDAILLRATAHDPNARYQNALEMAADLAAARLGY